MKSFVLDASFALAWVIADERTPETMRHFDALVHGTAEAIVPALWPDEVANVLVMLERRGKMTATQILNWTETLAELPIEVRPPSVIESLKEVRVLAQIHQLTAYDARYLHLAMQEGLPLATCDRQLLAVASKVGVRLVNARS